MVKNIRTALRATHTKNRYTETRYTALGTDINLLHIKILTTLTLLIMEYMYSESVNHELIVRLRSPHN